MNTLSGKILAIVMSLFLVFYVGYQVYRYVYSPVKTESVQQYTISDKVYAQGVVVRDEIPVAKESEDVVSYYYEDGVRVITKTPVAEVHSSLENVKIKHHIEEIEDEIARLDTIQKNSSGVLNVSAISGQIEDRLTELIKMNVSGSLHNAKEVHNNLQDTLNKKDIAIREEFDFASKISALQSEKETYLKQLTPPGATVNSPAYGYFSSYCDTAATAISTDLLLSNTVSQWEQLSAQRYEQDSSYSGKVIRGYDWYYVALISKEEAQKFYTGKTATLLFSADASCSVPGTVTRIVEDDSSGKVAVVFCCNYMSREISSMRNPSAQIELGTFRGLKIPYKALRFQGEEQGVYVLENQALIFKKVSILYEGVGFFISTIDTNDETAVQLYDDVVTEGVDLYDGKVLTS